MQQHPPYKDSKGRWRTRSLFAEYTHEKFDPIFTLQENDLDSLPSVRRLFLEYEDPTGYKFAKEHLKSYEHWRKLLEAGWFQAHFKNWLAELEVRLESGALQKIKAIAESNAANALQANRYLADRGWQPKRGRPSKAEKDQAARAAAEAESAVEDDLDRIRLIK